MPIAQMPGQTAPFAAMLNHVEQGIKELQIRHAHIAALTRQTISDALKLTLSEFHARQEYQLFTNGQLVLTLISAGFQIRFGARPSRTQQRPKHPPLEMVENRQP
jgi:hypothetical protein